MSLRHEQLDRYYKVNKESFFLFLDLYILYIFQKKEKERKSNAVEQTPKKQECFFYDLKKIMKIKKK